MNKPLKIIITGTDIDYIFKICKYIINTDDNINMSKIFTSNIDYVGVESENFYFMDINVINISYKNNSLLCTYTSNDITTGITLDDMYNNDLIPMNIWHFNNIPNNVLYGSELYDVLVLTIDSKYHGILDNLEMIEVKYMYDNICSDKNIKYMYFLDEEYENIYNTILEYINADEENKKKILEENQ